jgi:hypothetical protein
LKKAFFLLVSDNPTFALQCVPFIEDAAEVLAVANHPNTLAMLNVKCNGTTDHALPILSAHQAEQLDALLQVCLRSL